MRKAQFSSQPSATSLLRSAQISSFCDRLIWENSLVVSDFSYFFRFLFFYVWNSYLILVRRLSVFNFFGNSLTFSLVFHNFNIENWVSESETFESQSFVCRFSEMNFLAFTWLLGRKMWARFSFSWACMMSLLRMNYSIFDPSSRM